MTARTESQERLYLDDLRVGQTFTSGKYVMEEPRMKSFAAEFDPQPFHLDAAVASDSIFRGLAASGWYTAAASMRLMVDGELRIAGGRHAQCEQRNRRDCSLEVETESGNRESAQYHRESEW